VSSGFVRVQLSLLLPSFEGLLKNKPPVGEPSTIEHTMLPENASLLEPEIPPRPSQSLTNKVAIVTGAGSQSAGIGNGRAAAILLVEAGSRVVCADINLEWAKTTVSMIEKEFGEGNAVAIEADVTNETHCKKMVETALEKFGRLDILVNNVGVGGPEGTAVNVDPKQWAKGLEINVTSMMLMAKYAVPAMERNILDGIGGRGSIVNIASVAGLVGGIPMLLYPTSKGAIVNMTRAMAVHHAPMGIRVNCVCPGALLPDRLKPSILVLIFAIGLLYTPMLYSRGMPPEVREARRMRSILQTEGNGWDCGAAVRFLASEQGRWMTGVVLPVDAGATAAIAGSSSTMFSTLAARAKM
jgi:NAD(P)-dependent dehydrogenase (short-subunit alcohol dehydrogenase family)